MAIGLPVSTAEINNTLGNKARDFYALYSTTKALSARLKLYQDADLATIGFATADIASIRGFEQFADTLCALFDGSAPLPAAHNFLADISAVIGVGV